MLKFIQKLTRQLKNSTPEEKRFLYIYVFSAIITLVFFFFAVLEKDRLQNPVAVLIFYTFLVLANIGLTMRFISYGFWGKENILKEDIPCLLERVPSPFLMLSDREVVYMNRAMRDILDIGPFDEPAAFDFERNIAPEFRKSAEEWLFNVKNLDSCDELKIKINSHHKNGLWLSLQGAVIGTKGSSDILVSAFDISEIKRNELMMRKLGDLKDQIILLADSIQNHDSIIPLLERILDISLSKISNSLFGSFLVLENSEYFRIAVYRGFPPEEISGALIPYKQSFAYLAGGGDIRRTVIIDDIQKLPNIENSLQSFTSTIAWELRSTLSTPVFVHGKLYGSINIDSNHVNAFDEEDALLMEFFKENVEKAIEKAEEIIELKSKSYLDFLTGLHNRAYFEEALNEAIYEAENSGRIFSIAVVDLDYLKSVNDRFGHTGGDLLLKHFSDCLVRALPSTTLVCRHGGDEFALIFPDTNEFVATELMNAASARLAHQELKFGDDHIPVLFSYGVSEYSLTSMNTAVMVELADSHMYEMKWLHKKGAMEIMEANQ